MRITGSHVLDARRSEVWPRVVDPRSLVGLIPGCQHLEREGPEEFRGLIVLGLPAVSGSFVTFVRILERQEPRTCSFEGQVTGPTGIVTGTASFTLRDLDGQTELKYDAEGMVTGALAKLPARFVEGVARGLLEQGLARLSDELSR